MRFHLLLLIAAFSVVTSFGVGARGQETSRNRTQTPDWPLHNIDLHNTRYSSLDQIDTSNAGRLGVSWSFAAPAKAYIGATTPVVVDGVMYFNSGSQL